IGLALYAFRRIRLPRLALCFQSDSPFHSGQSWAPRFFNRRKTFMTNTTRQPGRHFLQIPGPTPVPERVIQAMARTIIDHRSQEFSELGLRVLGGIKTIFKTKQPVIMFPSSGTGAWEAALLNTLSPGDKVLMVETGQFATLWKDMAVKLGLVPEFLPTDWRIGAEADVIESRLRQDSAHEIKAVCVVHNETATGCRTWIDEVRKAI